MDTSKYFIYIAFFILWTPLASIADVKVEIDASGRIFAYQLVDVATGELTYWLLSSYQPTNGDNPNFAADHTQGVTVAWNGDKTAIAISEETHNFIGNLWVLTMARDSGAYIEVFTPSIQEDILKKVNLDIERHRYFFSKWITNEIVEITLSARYRETPNKEKIAFAEFLVRLDFSKTNPIVTVTRMVNE